MRYTKRMIPSTHVILSKAKDLVKDSSGFALRMTMVIFIFLLYPISVFAGQYDIKQMTPAIEQALHGREMRYAQLQQLKASGAIGENHQGLTHVLKPQPGAETISEAENADRLVLYNAIADQNQLGGAGLSQIKKVFAEVQREKARGGDFIQLRSGDWTQK